MKKYKHKITGNIAKETNSGNNYKVSEPRHFTVPKWVIENSTDWEEVVERDYEILSFSKMTSKMTSENHIYTVRDNGRLLWDCPEYSGLNADPTAPHWTEAVKKGYKIHSVKRLSDGEVFTVGDRIKTCAKDDYACIYGFVIKNGQLSIDHTHSYLLDCKFPDTRHGHHLHLISRDKKPIFTTEDGVDIFRGDTVYKVNTKYEYSGIYENILADGRANGRKYFSTKEAAEEYILMNKPCLSINEITNLIQIGLVYTRVLKDAVKLKL